MSEAVLNLGKVISGKSDTLRDILNQVPSNVEITHIFFEGFNVNALPETKIYFQSADFKFTPIAQSSPNVKWDGKKLDFTDCWDPQKVSQSTTPPSFQLSQGLSYGAITSWDLVDDVFRKKILGCLHVWKKYTGIVDSYTYCDKCGDKQK